jgi:hypothetical protein
MQPQCSIAAAELIAAIDLQPRNAADAAARRFLVMAQEQDFLIDGPGIYDTLETWERHLSRIEALPGNGDMKREALKHAREMVERKRRD